MMITLIGFTFFVVTCPFNDLMVCRIERIVNFNSLELARFSFEIRFAAIVKYSACNQALQ